MEIAKVIAEYLKIAAWPAVVLTFFCLFREEISGAIGRLSGLDIAGLQWTFAQRAATTRQETEQLAPPHPQPEPPANNSTDTPDSGPRTIPGALFLPISVPTGEFATARRIAMTQPRAAIELAWDAMDKALLRAIAQRDAQYAPSLHGAASWVFIHNQLQTAGIETDALMALGELRALRNTASADPRVVTTEAAINFVESSQTLTMRAMEALAPH
ncbi:hypothetical protein [Streptomyces sp. NPDC052179]|uniref:hypothetical protein n=1 Tax=Streptomyces sp. NPDC052179 TaxID=3155680 RepID=UPI00344A838A